MIMQEQAYIADSFYREFWAADAPFLTRLKKGLESKGRQEIIELLDEKRSEEAEKCRSETHKRLSEFLKGEAAKVGACLATLMTLTIILQSMRTY
jgi:hypothetical protein